MRAEKERKQQPADQYLVEVPVRLASDDSRVAACRTNFSSPAIDRSNSGNADRKQNKREKNLGAIAAGVQI